MEEVIESFPVKPILIKRVNCFKCKLKSEAATLNEDLASSNVGLSRSLAYLNKYSPLPHSILKAPKTPPSSSFPGLSLMFNTKIYKT